MDLQWSIEMMGYLKPLWHRHAFTNEDHADTYNKAAHALSTERMIKFFNTHLSASVSATCTREQCMHWDSVDVSRSLVPLT